jgi:hypothetical protein
MPKTRTAKGEDLRSLRGSRDRGALPDGAAIRVSSVNMIEISLNCFHARPSMRRRSTHDDCFGLFRPARPRPSPAHPLGWSLSRFDWELLLEWALGNVPSRFHS